LLCPQDPGRIQSEVLTTRHLRWDSTSIVAMTPIQFASDVHKSAFLLAQGRFILAAGLVVSLETSLAEAEGAGLTLPGGKLLDSLRCFPARHGLGVARAGALDHPPEPPGLGPVATFFGQEGEVVEGQVAVDALVDA
jgi:hypothetical protein